MYLKCPVCGFEWGIFFAEGAKEEEKKELMMCPCGTECGECDEIEFFSSGLGGPEPPKEEA